MSRVTQNNGVCNKKNPDGSRKHTMKKKKDAKGKVYESCEKCGALLLEVQLIKVV